MRRGRLLYGLKPRRRDGTKQVIYEPLEFPEKLAVFLQLGKKATMDCLAN